MMYKTLSDSSTSIEFEAFAASKEELSNWLEGYLDTYNPNGYGTIVKNIHEGDGDYRVRIWRLKSCD